MHMDYIWIQVKKRIKIREQSGTVDLRAWFRTCILISEALVLYCSVVSNLMYEKNILRPPTPLKMGMVKKSSGAHHLFRSNQYWTISFKNDKKYITKLQNYLDSRVNKLVQPKMYLRELAFAISFVSLGSNQILFLPHLSTLEARRFWRRSVLKLQSWKLQSIACLNK